MNNNKNIIIIAAKFKGCDCNKCFNDYPIYSHSQIILSCLHSSCYKHYIRPAVALLLATCLAEANQFERARSDSISALFHVLAAQAESNFQVLTATLKTARSIPFKVPCMQ